MGIIKTFVSHSRTDRDRVAAILRRVAPFGVRPCIDEQDLAAGAGLSQSDSIRDAIDDPSIPALSLFLSAASLASRWVELEVGHALRGLVAGRRIIPIALDPLPGSKLPANFAKALRMRGAEIDAIYLDPAREGFVEDYAAAVLEAGGLHRAEDVVLYLGHRDPESDPELPEPWRTYPAVDLRLGHAGDPNCSPTEDEWAEVRAGVSFLRRRLRSVQTLHIAGRAPIGAAVIVGRAWDRGTHVRLEGWDRRNASTWSSRGVVTIDGWEPSPAGLLPARLDRAIGPHARRLLIALLPMVRYEVTTTTWNAARASPPPILFVRCPLEISSAAEAAALVSEVLGIFSWVRTAHPQVREVDLIVGLPLPLAAILAHHLRQVGNVNFYDQVLPEGDRYRLAIAWP